MRVSDEKMNKVQECKRCLLSTSDTSIISFDSEGVCNYCKHYDEVIKSLGNEEQKKIYLNKKIEEIRLKGKGYKYDCILGLSGGVDSSYLALIAKDFGLRPLVVHLDNGWNSEIAVQNIEKICDKLNFDLYTHVIDWEEFREIQMAYLKASVVDIEVPTDHAIYAIIRKMAIKHNIKYVISGFNYATEAIMPKGWAFDKSDLDNIKDITSKFSKIKKFKTFPTYSFWDKLKEFLLYKIEVVRPLNYIYYEKNDAIKRLQKEVDWQEYKVKHGESLFTKFYQQYILPQKFSIDKRKAHLSNLICSGQITKENAQKELSEKKYSETEFIDDEDYFLKKFNFEKSEFEKIMNSPINNHSDFATEQRKWNYYFKIIKMLKGFKK